MIQLGITFSMLALLVAVVATCEKAPAIGKVLDHILYKILGVKNNGKYIVLKKDGA